MKKTFKQAAITVAIGAIVPMTHAANFTTNNNNALTGTGGGYDITLSSNGPGVFASNASVTIQANNDSGTNGDTTSGEGVVLKSDTNARSSATFLTNGIASINADSRVQFSTNNLDSDNTTAAGIALWGEDTTYKNRAFITGSGGVSINASGIDGNVSIGNGNAVNFINGSNNTMTTATGTNTLSAVANKIEASGQFGTNAMTAGASNTISAGTTNTITGGTGNVITATTGNNSMTATAGANTISAGTTNTITGATGNSMTATTGANTISAMGTSGANTMQATVANNLTSATNNLSATGVNGINNITATAQNSIQGPVNDIGTDSASSNNIGNGIATTNVTAQGGNAGMLLQQDLAGMSVEHGTSGLATRTDADGNAVANSATRATVTLTNTAGASVDANGKLTDAQANEANGTVIDAPTAALTLTNGYGNTHGIVVTESQTTISGGTQSSSMTLADNGATFSNAETGAPVQVHGVADGTADFDAINVRQFAGAIAAVTAQANIPSLAAGQDKTIGVGLGHFMGKTGLAVGMNLRGKKNGIYKLSVSTGLNGGAKFVVGGGAAWSF